MKNILGVEAAKHVAERLFSGRLSRRMGAVSLVAALTLPFSACSAFESASSEDSPQARMVRALQGNPEALAAHEDAIATFNELEVPDIASCGNFKVIREGPSIGHGTEWQTVEAEVEIDRGAKWNNPILRERGIETGGYQAVVKMPPLRLSSSTGKFVSNSGKTVDEKDTTFDPVLLDSDSDLKEKLKVDAIRATLEGGEVGETSETKYVKMLVPISSRYDGERVVEVKLGVESVVSGSRKAILSESFGTFGAVISNQYSRQIDPTICGNIPVKVKDGQVTIAKSDSSS